MNKRFLSMLMAAGLTFSFGVAAQGNAEAGKDKVAVCAACHGADGNSAAANFPKLAGQGEKYLLKQLIDIKTGTRPVVEMTGLLDNSSEQDLKDMAAFYASQTISIGQANKELAEEGRTIYQAGIPAKNVAACTACHGPAGKGIALAGFPALGGQHADYTASQLKKFRSGERVNDGESRIMRSIAARLSDREIEAVSSYISGLYQ
ncbi:MAG: cytochrome c4 [Oleiphilus sp.]|nr:MAG: cytochrome c4 [Oleiphilus sp.]